MDALQLSDFHKKAMTNTPSNNRRVLCLLMYLSLAPVLLVAQTGFDALDMRPKWNGASYDPGLLRFCDSNDWPTSTDCVGVSSAPNSAAYDVRLPSTVGTAGQALVTDGNDPLNLSWAANSPGNCPAGSDTQLQFNDSGSCGGLSNYTLNKGGVEAQLVLLGTKTSINSTVHSTVQTLGQNLNSFIARGTPGAPTATLINDVMFAYEGYGHTGSGFNRSIILRMSAPETYSPTSTPSQFEFWNTASGSTTIRPVWYIRASGAVIPGANKAYPIGAAAARISTGYAGTWNAERSEFTNPSDSAHMSAQFTAAGFLEFWQTDNTLAWRIDNTDNEITTYGRQRPDVDNTGTIGKQDSFEYAEFHGKAYIADDAFVVQSSENSEFQTCNSTTFKWGACTVSGRWHADGGPSGDFATSSLELGTAAGTGAATRHEFFTKDDNGRYEISNDTNNVVIQMGGQILGDIVGGLDLDSGIFRMNDESGNRRVQLTVIDTVTLADYGEAVFYSDGGLPGVQMRPQTIVNSDAEVIVGDPSDITGHLRLYHSGDSEDATMTIFDEGTTVQFEFNRDLYPSAANTLNLGGSGKEWLDISGNFFHVRSSAGTCTIISGSGAPSGPCNTCDVALRTDGVADATIYVCEASVWNAVATF